MRPRPVAQAAADRKATKQALEEAKKELGDAMMQLASQAAKQLGDEAKESGELGPTRPSPWMPKPHRTLAMPSTRPSRPRATPRAAGRDAGRPERSPPGPRPGLGRTGRPPGSRSPPKLAQAQAAAQSAGPVSPGPVRPGHEARGRCRSLPTARRRGRRRWGPAVRLRADGKGPDGQDLRKEPWFANLPPEARDTMRSNAQRRPPPGYERRTQEYFENLDR